MVKGLNWISIVALSGLAACWASAADQVDRHGDKQVPRAKAIPLHRSPTVDYGAFKDLPPDEMVRASETVLKTFRPEDEHSRGKLYAIVDLMRRRPRMEYVAAHKKVLAHPAVPAYVKAVSLRAIYEATGDTTIVEPFLESEEDKLLAAALDLLAPERIGEPEFDKMLEPMLARPARASSTSQSIGSIKAVIQFKQSYDAETNMANRVEMLALKMDWCSRRSLDGDDDLQIGESIFAQYLFLQFQEAFRLAPDLTASAITQHGERKAKWKPLAKFLLEALRAAEEEKPRQQ